MQFTHKLPFSPPTLNLRSPFLYLPVAFTCSVDHTSSLSHWIPFFLFFSIACGTGAKILGKGKWCGSFVLTCRTVYLAFVLRCAFEYFNVICCFISGVVVAATEFAVDCQLELYEDLDGRE
ncbi:hypothetical protein BDQ94DRAFT_79146 [Aspergillus welwitschiae]|uniref:Transmembrane protein n=1 Tax=Aspergillus welwitschiae TaxID=1341132 RepID=A0A3F3PT50_9EURO|nr:hypothetical protein BDQ94DRAFT_79146 [Aspergillus welwitschiae]RDH30094.1 hypothetical protein BDQ94DRAFT_79146 [Aspergillus welwitschiae]